MSMALLRYIILLLSKYIYILIFTSLLFFSLKHHFWNDKKKLETLHSKEFLNIQKLDIHFPPSSIKIFLF